MILSQDANSCRKARLQQIILKYSYFNLLLVALAGVWLRTFPFLSNFPLAFKNVLHGHSHFAFTGWIMLVLLGCLLKFFPDLTKSVSYHHWRNITGMVMVSAYGMLISFPLQGYKTISILFSTVAVLATVYLTLVVWKATKSQAQPPSIRFVKWGLLLASLSSLGPIATGPLAAVGKAGSPLYFDAIYFYLHFQYNGFFTFFVLAFLYRIFDQQGSARHGNIVFCLTMLAVVPTYALSVLWHQPHFLVNIVAGGGMVLQIASLPFLLKDSYRADLDKMPRFLRLSIAAFLLKNLLQLAGVFSVVATMAYQYRNFVIAYLHLVLLGFVSLFIFYLTTKENVFQKWGLRFFLFSFCTTEILLVLQSAGAMFSVSLPFYPQLMLLCSLFFPIGILLLLRSRSYLDKTVSHQRNIAVVSESVLRVC